MTEIGSVPLSNDDEAVIQRTLPPLATNDTIEGRRTPNAQVHHVYEVARTTDEIARKGYRRIALQFPDELLVDAASVVSRLEEAIAARSAAAAAADDASNSIGSPRREETAMTTSFYVLGDTSYGSCCVDEVAAEHVDADAVVHYGRSCLSPTSKLPVIYVFGRLPLNLDLLASGVVENFTDAMEPLMVVTDTTYFSSQANIVDKLADLGYHNVITTELRDMEHDKYLTGDECLEESEKPMRTLPGRTYSLPRGQLLSDTTMLFIGPPSPTLTTTLMTHSASMKAIHSFNPLTGIISHETSQNAALRRRYATVQKARDAGVIGIVVGTLGVSRYLDLIKHLRVMVSSVGKKSYLFAMGKLNPSKMANFSEVEAFVLVACGENSLVESREFYRPVVTPFELSLALRTRAHEAAVPWTGEWLTDFEKVLDLPAPPDSQTHRSNGDEGKEQEGAGVGAEVDESDEEAPHFSLVTGTYTSSSRPMHHNTTLETATLDASSVLTTRSKETAVGMVGGLFSPAARHLSQREHWGGLGTDHRPRRRGEKVTAADEGSDVKDGEEEESVALTQGRTGIARGYD